MRKHKKDTASYTCYLSSATVETGLTGVTRLSVTPEKRITNKKENIKSLALSPFIPVNKRLLNDENDHNPETIDTSLSEKDDMSHTSWDYFIEKTKAEINTNYYEEYKEETSKIRYGNESADNSETSDTLRDDSVIKTTK